MMQSAQHTGTYSHPYTDRIYNDGSLHDRIISSSFTMVLANANDNETTGKWRIATTTKAQQRKQANVLNHGRDACEDKLSDDA